MTRLMGSFETGDLLTDDEGVVAENIRRFVLNRSAIETIEGFPGRSSMTLEIAETNPFFVEKITNESQVVEEQIEDTSVKEILKKIYDFKLEGHARDAMLLEIYRKKVFFRPKSEEYEDEFGSGEERDVVDEYAEREERVDQYNVEEYDMENFAYYLLNPSVNMKKI